MNGNSQFSGIIDVGGPILTAVVQQVFGWSARVNER